MQTKNAYEILEKIKNGTSTAEERAIVESWYLQMKTEGPPHISEDEFTAVLDNIQHRLPVHSPPNTKRYWVAAAASLILICSIGLYFSTIINHHQQTNQEQTALDFSPGKNKAVLTLSDGSKVELDGKGALKKLTGNEKAIISTSSDGKLIYNTTASNASGTDSGASLNNMISTPRGGQYQVVLPDGTRVWLNAASSLRFPLVFKGSERKVVVTGEAYFEVAKVSGTQFQYGKQVKRRVPFIVETEKQRIEVLGTHFNVNSYSDENSTNTTLLEGSIRVSALQTSEGLAKELYTLKPGQQSRLTARGIAVTATDTEEAIAWKNGAISFVNADIKTIMRQVSRWYNVDIKYQGDIPERIFTGSISRSSKLSELLKILEFSNIKFSIRGHEITVLQ